MTDTTYATEPAADAGSDKATFAALIREWNAAVVANDPDAIAAFAEPDWVFVGENGMLAGERFLEAVATGGVCHDFRISEVHDVRVYGDIALSSSESATAACSRGARSPSTRVVHRRVHPPRRPPAVPAHPPHVRGDNRRRTR